MVRGFNPFEKYDRQIGMKSSPIFRVNIPKIFEFPPPIVINVCIYIYIYIKHLKVVYGRVLTSWVSKVDIG